MNQSTFDKIINEMILWLDGIFEDDPLPFEIRHATFFLSTGSSYSSLSVSFNETKNQYYDYNPLESEFFYNKEFFKLTKDILTKEICLAIIDEVTKSENLFDIFFNLKINVIYTIID